MRVTLLSAERVARDEAGLEDYKQETTDYINRLAGMVRSKFMVVTVGQQLIYMMKRRQALAYLANPLDVMNFLLIAVEIGINGADGEEVANNILSMLDDWEIMAGGLETIRLGTLDIVKAPASTRADCDACLVFFVDAIEVFGPL